MKKIISQKLQTNPTTAGERKDRVAIAISKLFEYDEIVKAESQNYHFLRTYTSTIISRNVSSTKYLQYFIVVIHLGTPILYI